MLNKRLVGVVTVKDGWAVQSFGYNRYLPLGKPECLVQNLDRWGVDEILLQVIDRLPGPGGEPDFRLLERIGRLGLETPLMYGGGVRSLRHGLEAVHSGADRVVLDSILRDDLAVARALSEHLGAQAVVASLPVSLNGDAIEWLDYRSGKSDPLAPEVLALARDAVISEFLLIDWKNEGHPGAFDMRLLRHFPLPEVSRIAFGGLSEAAQMSGLLALPEVSAVAVGNFLSYKEHAVQKYREALRGAPVRPAAYKANFPMLSDV